MGSAVNGLPARRSFNRHGAAAIEKQISDSLNALAAEKAQRDALVREATAAKRALRGSVTRDQLVESLNGALEALSGVAVRDDMGWHKVIRVNAKTVTVAGPWGGTRTIKIDRLLEVRR